MRLTENPEITFHSRLEGLIVGGAVGDAVGLPAEGMSRERIRRRWKGNWDHHFFFGRGMCSDDSEHTFMVAQALLTYPNDATRFQKGLAWKFRWWLLALPAGVGLATARAIVKLWIGFPADRSGVHSAGNGPAMRSAVIGAFFAGDVEKRREFVRASTRITHTDERAEIGAQAVAEAAAWTVRGGNDPAEFLKQLASCGDNEEWRKLCTQILDSYAKRENVTEFCDKQGLTTGVTGYVFHTVPVAIYAWARHFGNFEKSLTEALDCGGDTDSVGAIVGALAGATVGAENIPSRWVDGILEWPRSVAPLRKLSVRLERQTKQSEPFGPMNYFWPGIVLRNLIFLPIVLLHGLRRLVP